MRSAPRPVPTTTVGAPAETRAAIRLGVVAAGVMDPWDVVLLPPLAEFGVSSTIMGRPGDESLVPLVEVQTFRDFSPWRRVPTLEGLGFKIHGFAWDHRLSWPPSPFTFDDSIIGLFKHLLGFDVLMAFETYRASTYQACRHHPGVIVKVTENIPHNPPQVLYRWFKTFVRARAARFACVTESARNALLQEGFPEDRVLVIPEAVDTDVFHPGDCPPPQSGTLRIGFAGKLDDLHGFPDLLEAFENLVQEMDVTLKVAGSGPYLQDLQTVVARLGLASRVEYLGKLPHSRMPEFMAGIDVLCIPCRTVAGWTPQFGVANIEAMACGKPIVATRVGATSEIVPPALQQFLVPESDVRSLREALRVLCLEPDLRVRLGAKAVEWVEQHFDVRRVAKQWAQLVTEVYDELHRG